MIEAVIFDMDGLLIDSEPFWREAHGKALKRHGHTLTIDDHRTTMGRRTDEVARHWHKHFSLTISPEELEQEVVAHLIEQVSINGQQLPGVQNIIGLLQEHGLPMAVASSSAPEIIDVVMKKLDLARHMKLVYSTKYEKFGKPHPGVFLTTAKKLGVAPKNCLVFEDSITGVKAAKAAGMKCIAVPSQEDRGRPEIKEADLVVNSLKDVTWEDINNLWK